MKNAHIALLIFIAMTMSLLISLSGNLTTYDTISSAMAKEGKFVHLVARLDKDKAIEYDPVKNPNYLSFTAIDSLGKTIKVVYYNSKPDNLELSERIVLKGAVRSGSFECKEILLKCPSKYKDEKSSEPVKPSSILTGEVPYRIYHSHLS